MKKALITGITGQDGSYLAEFLLSKGYQVHGIIRRASTFNTVRIDHILIDPHDPGARIFLHFGDLSDAEQISNLIYNIKPDEVYHLAAQSHVRVSFDIPEYTGNVTALGTVRLLEAIRRSRQKIKFYQASSSEMFGAAPAPQSENTVFQPQSPYACAKVYAYWMVKNYREGYGLFACNGILFNHESPRRGETFVTRKITRGLANIMAGKQKQLYLGNLDAKRDWGFAPEYCIDLETSILTNEGFKFYDEIKEGDIVLNYNQNKDSLDRDKVLKKVLLSNSGEMYIFEGKGFKLRCSTRHRIYYQKKSKNSKGGWSDWIVAEAKDFYAMIKNLKNRSRYDYRLPHTQNYKRRDLKIKDEWFKLIGYLIAEGCVKSNNRVLEVSLSQSERVNERFYKDVKLCISRLNLKYRERRMNCGTSEFCFDAASSRKIMDYFEGFDVHVFPRWIFNAGNRQMELVLEAMMNGDGCWGTMVYVSRRKDIIHFFQTLATILGYRTVIHERKSRVFECALLSKRKKYAYITKSRREVSKEKVWCITTNNGTVVTKKDEGIAVSGNCEVMWKILQQENPDDYVVGTAESHSVREFIEKAFFYVGISISWQGKGIKTKGIVDALHAKIKVPPFLKKGSTLIKIDPEYFRPNEVHYLCADIAKARQKLSWQPRVKFDGLVKIMVDYDLKAAGVKAPGEGLEICRQKSFNYIKGK